MHLRKAIPFVVLIACSAFLFWRTLGFEYQHVPGRLGPDIWPKIILVLLVITCLFGMALSFLPAEEHTSPNSFAADDAPQSPPRHGLVALGFALFLMYPIALVYLGFPVATFVLMVLFMIVGQWRHPVGVLVSSILGTLVLFYVFHGIVYISLPLGTGPFEDFTLWLSQLMRIR
ncbi:MAG TPA: tripartite tricarboxylate transporter TctB family protein [Hyphomicrobiaceae bacterium]|nr:tripartite tricarboxylate transporter TctB family protein [Hyphomicrobiaceae bacterium]